MPTTKAKKEDSAPKPPRSSWPWLLLLLWALWLCALIYMAWPYIGKPAATAPEPLEQH